MVDEDEIYPVTIGQIAEAQRQDDKLKRLFEKRDKKNFPRVRKTLLEEEVVLCYRKEENDSPRMVIPESLQKPIITWFHHYLQHPGAERLYETLAATMYWRGMSKEIKQFTKHCKRCQLGKKRKRKYGKLPPKLADVVPFGSCSS